MKTKYICENCKLEFDSKSDCEIHEKICLYELVSETHVEDNYGTKLIIGEFSSKYSDFVISLERNGSTNFFCNIVQARKIADKFNRIIEFYESLNPHFKIANKIVSELPSWKKEVYEKNYNTK